MDILFLGTGTSMGVPMIGCRCEVCLSPDPRDKRWRPSIALRFDDGTQVLVDTTPDLRSQALAFELMRVDAVVYTHSHADHIFGLDELRRYIALQGGGRSPSTATRTRLDDLSASSPTRSLAGAGLGGGRAAAAARRVDGPLSIGADTQVVPVPILHGVRRSSGSGSAGSRT